MPGGSLAVAERELGQRESRNALDDDSLAIVEFVNDRESDGYATTAGEVAERMGWDKKKATTYLGRLAENHIRRRARGVYGGLPQGAVVSEVSVVTPEPDETTQTTVTTHPSGNEPILEWGVNPKEQEQAS